MELQKQTSAETQKRPRIRVIDKLSLEDYVRFICSAKTHDLTCELLRQIIHMHGFRKGKLPKTVLKDALQPMELMEPTRSTLKGADVSGNAFISMEEAVKDLCELKWQECCITSIQMVNSSNYICPVEPVSTTIAGTTSSSKRKLAAIENASSGGEGEGAGSAESACCSGGGNVVRKSRSKKQRSLHSLTLADELTN